MKRLRRGSLALFLFGTAVLSATAQEIVPPNYVPRTVQVFEAHWQGLDGRMLTGELRRKLRFPDTMRGILIGEVTLNAAASGLLAGDVIVDVAESSVVTIEEFQRATRRVQNQPQSSLTVLRKGTDNAFTRLTFVLRAEPELGFAQVEGAPMILPGAERPHPYRGPCTDCHPIGRGFELQPDPDLITLPPPPLRADVAARGMRPHDDRGPCVACHGIVQ